MDKKRVWQVREYQPGDEQGIIDLWRTVFFDGESERAKLPYWYWQFRDNPAGSGRIKLAVVEDMIVGHYAVVPVRMQVMGQSILGTLSLDTMTHADYRRQGMFQVLAGELYADLGRDGMPITYGFPNDNSLGGLVRKLDWTHICSLPVYVKPINVRAIMAKVISNRLLASLIGPAAQAIVQTAFRKPRLSESERQKLTWVDAFDQRADELWQEAYDQGKIAVTRSADFLNWRYLTNPTRNYRAIVYAEGEQMVAYSVVRCMEQFGLRGGMITELVARPGRIDACQTILAAAMEHFAAEKMDVAACLIHGDSDLASLLKRNRFLVPPAKISFKEWYFGGRVNNDSITQEMLDDPRNWYVTFGDVDVI